jgi:predicted  nucleic acid-binding Zn-ribbon protein
MAELEVALAQARAVLAEVGKRQAALEHELAQVESKLAEDQSRLYSGTVGIIRELQALQTEVDALKRRKGDLEDRVLEVLDEREPLDNGAAALEAEQEKVFDEAGEVEGLVVAAQAEIDVVLASEVGARAAAADGLPPAVVAEYDRLRARLGGIGAAPLVNGRCGGCHLSLSASELDALRRQPPDALLCCEQCGRILVR